MICALDLPFPPTTNHIYRRTRTGVYLSDKTRRYRYEVLALCMAEGVARRERTERLAVMLEVHEGVKRPRCDIDNVCKATLDALQAAGVYADDQQIDELWVLRGARRAVGTVRAFVRVADDGHDKIA